MTEGSATLEQRSGKAERKPLLRALARETCATPPVWLMRQAGRYLPEYRALRARAGGFLELCLTPELAAEATLQPVRRFGLDAAILFSDILMIPMALGQKLQFSESEGPLLEPLGDSGQTARYGLERLHGPLAPVYEAIERVKSALEPDSALIGFAGAPWTVASYMIEGRTSRDFAAVKLFAFTRPDDFAHLIALLVEASAAYLIRQVAAGAEVLQIFDSWAGALGESEFDAWCIEPIRRIVAQVKAVHPQIPIIAFPRGAGLGYRRFVARTGVDGISLDPAVPLAWAARELQGQAVLQGNLDPVKLVSGGDAMREAAERILASWGGGPFIFNLGHGVLQTTPPEHVARLVALVRGERASRPEKSHA
ncbi:MAG TPA: uroporphyrinogen decarboxylase [Alphaproteobacteria bacterium]|nr:uroporphyrinogen decarboxylase [Alphaproteobacteria bacterium]